MGPDPNPATQEIPQKKPQETTLAPFFMRSFSGVLASNLAFGIAVGFFLALMPLRVKEMGVEAGAVGANGLGGSMSIFILAVFFSKFLTIASYRSLMAGGSLLTTLSVLVMIPFENYWAWFLLRLIGGIGICTHWMASESWINQMSNTQNRGRLIGLYITAFLGGMAAGPLLLPLVGVDGVKPLLTLAALTGLATLFCLPIIAQPSKSPHPPPGENLRLIKDMPRLLSITLFMGLAQGAMISMMSYYGVEIGMSVDRAAQALSIVLIGSVLLQAPLGMISDYFNRNTILIILALTSLVTGWVSANSAPDQLILFVALFIYGTALFGMYTIALALLGDRYAGRPQLPAANAILILIWEFGSMSGAPSAGLAMQFFGAKGFFDMQLAVVAIVLGLAVWRRLSPDPVRLGS